MTCLVYCIMRDIRPIDVKLPLGVDNKRISLVSEGGLLAACSAVPDELTRPTVCRARAYARVVGKLHGAALQRGVAVLPLRYGSVLGSKGQVALLLRERAGEFRAALQKLDGCVEMGILMILKLGGRRAASREAAGCSDAAGAGYLQARRLLYAEEDGYARAAAAEAEKCRGRSRDYSRSAKPNRGPSPALAQAWHCCRCTSL